MRAVTLPAPKDLFTAAPRTRRWQKVVQLAPVRVVLGVVFLVPATLAAWSLQRFSVGQQTVPVRLAAAAISIVLYALSQAAFARLVERRPAHELGLRGAGVEAIFGAVIGVALLATTVFALVLSGHYRLSLGRSAMPLLTGLATFGPAALFEELLLRAVFFKITEEALGSRLALLLSAAVFGAMHLGNPNATWVAGLAIALEAGVLLAIAFMVTRRIWLAWGVHLGWNYAQGALFGIRVSGHAPAPAFLDAVPTGPAWLTGGDFGVEASPVAVVVCLVASVLLWRVAARRARVLLYRQQRAR
jgi:membrane protease YdiL (CAAX protease family)